MNTLRRIVPAIMLVPLMLFIACTGTKGWNVSGNVADAPQGTKLTLEAYNNGHWYIVDSLLLNDRGDFDYTSPAAAQYPEIMRVTLDGRSIYFPVDSVDRISIITSADNFDGEYTLAGTPQAALIRSIDSLIAARVAVVGVEQASHDSMLKRRLTEYALADSGVIAGYYVINKTVGGKRLFDPESRSDLRVIGAVVQRFTQQRPDDPRTAYLSQIFLQARLKHNPDLLETTTVEVPESGLIDITLYDRKGNARSLAEEASRGNVLLLSFSAYGIEASPSYNMLLSELYNEYHAAGLEIYQISFDEEEVVWKETAANLPWTSVWNAPSDGNNALMSYNVGALPLTFIIDRQGNLAKRVPNAADLKDEVRAAMKKQ